MQPRESPGGWARLVPLGLVLFTVGIVPLGSALYNSLFHDVYGVRSFAGLDNFRALLQDHGFGLSLRITILWALANTALVLVLAFVFAVHLSRKGPFPRLFYGILLIPWGVPVYIAVPIWRAILHGNAGQGLLDLLFGIRVNLLVDPAAGFLGALMVSVWTAVPIAAFLILGSIAKTNRSTTEAARIDGAGEARIALSIYLPQLRETLLVVGVLSFMRTLKEFTVVFLMTAGGPPLLSGITSRSVIGATTTLEIFLYDMFRSSEDTGLPSAFAALMIVFVLVVMAIWFVLRSRRNRPWIVGILAGATQVFLGGPLRLLWIVGYLASVRWRRLFAWTLVTQLVVQVVLIITRGLPAGIVPGIAVPLLLIFARGGRRGGPWNKWASRGRDRSNGARREERDSASHEPRHLGPLEEPVNVIWRFSRGALSLLMAASCVLVVYTLVWLSFSRLSTVHLDGIIPQFASARSYAEIFIQERMARYFGNTLFVAGATAVLIPLVTFPAAAYLSDRSPTASAGLLTTIQAVGVVGGMHALIPLYTVFRAIGLIDTYVPLIVVYLGHSITFGMFTITAYLRGLPPSLREAAQLEGAGIGVYNWRILLPLSLPVVTTAAIQGFLGAWNGFLVPLLFLNDDARYTISVKLFSLVGTIASGNPRWNLFAAASMVNILILGLIFIRLRGALGSTALAEYDD